MHEIKIVTHLKEKQLVLKKKSIPINLFLKRESMGTLQEKKDLNLRLLVLETNVLPTELFSFLNFILK